MSAIQHSDFRLDKNGLYRCMDFRHFVWQDHAFGTRFADPPHAITLRQVHSDRVWNAHRLTDRQHEGDALYTDDVQLRIGVRTADCVPLLIVDAQNHAVAAVHAGWRGSVSRVVQHTLERMSRVLGTNASEVYVALGPCIRVCCYEVGRDVASQFAPYFPEWPAMNGDKFNVDLPETNRRHLLGMGVKADHIFDSGLCTKCNPEQFFSYRREPENPGRMLSTITRLA